MKVSVVAVDFDGTLCESKWPDIGMANEQLIQRIILMQRQGVKFILWTCREGKLLEDAVAWCKERGLIFDSVNDNLPERIEQYANNCRKVSADEYWDDRAVWMTASGMERE